MISEAAVPSIKLFFGPDFNSPETVRELLCGAEEEGVPCDVEAGEGGAVALAYKAAEASVVGVGLGVDKAGIAALHYSKLPEDKPLFTLNYRIDNMKLRDLASNAARLVKGMPFVIDERTEAADVLART